MTAGHTTSSPTRLVRLQAGLLAQRGAEGAWVVALQLLLIVLWHPVLIPLAWALSEDVIVPAARLWYEIGEAPAWRESASFNLPADPKDRLALFAIFGLVPVVEAVVAYIPYRIVTRRARFSLAHFVRLWWRTWLWGTLLVPAGAVVLSLLPPWLREPVSGLAFVTYVLLAPGGFAQQELRSAHRLARWRPVCPECGYSLRRLVELRCPECGQAFPSTNRVYRRWAWRRAPWDRVARDSLLFVYVKTVFMIVCRPATAARGLLVPDRFPRALRWATAHLLLAALLGVGVGSDQFFLIHLVDSFTDTFRGWQRAGERAPQADAVVTWAVQSLSAWLIALGTLPLLGIGLGVIVPGRHPAAKRGVAKWSLYVTIVPMLLLVVGSVVWRSYMWHNSGAWTIWWQMLLVNPLPGGRAVTVMAGIYGVWWAFGVAANPYLRRRGLDVFVVNSAVYCVVWLVLTGVLFNPGGLQWLL